MDDKRFDEITQALAGDASRRRMLGGLIGGVAGLLVGAASLEAKRGGKGKGRGNNGNGNGRGAGTVKVQLCHRNHGKKGFSLITVGAPAVPAHERHGDTVCETDRACAVVTGCDEDGACTFEAAPEGTACEVEGVAGTCDAEGACVADDGGLG